MKNFIKSALLITIGTIAFSSCMKKDTDNFDYEAEAKKQEHQLDSLLTAQKSSIEIYKNQYYPEAVQDTVQLNFTRLNKKVKRGIWYQVITPATDNSYTYGLNSTGTAINFPLLKLKYTARLVSNNTIVESDLTGTDYNLGIQSSKITTIWYYSFFPYAVKFNGVDRILEGLTESGLKKGAKFVVIAPSYYAYGNKAVTSTQGNIPANSPLAYEFEVLDIK